MPSRTWLRRSTILSSSRVRQPTFLATMAPFTAPSPAVNEPRTKFYVPDADLHPDVAPPCNKCRHTIFSLVLSSTVFKNMECDECKKRFAA